MASVFLGDLDDFIGPAQACINPLFTTTTPPSTTAAAVSIDVGRSSIFTSIGAGAAGTPTTTTTSGSASGGGSGSGSVAYESSSLLLTPPLPQTEPDLIKDSGSKTARVTLSDCLACSGCVTTAETVIITQQSGAEFLASMSRFNTSSGEEEKKEKEEEGFSVVSISPQSRASIAAHFNVSALIAWRQLVAFFRHLGASYVIDTTAAADLTLLEAREEFIARYRNVHSSSAGGGGASATAVVDKAVMSSQSWKKPAESAAVCSTRVFYPSLNADFPSAHHHCDEREEEGGERSTVPAPPQQMDYSCMPMLASACPGWVCYAEKTTPEALRYVSTAKSPMQVTGALVKDAHFRRRGGGKVYHTAIMPCFDKKLEASRKDFLDETSNSDDVDCVLTTTEVLDLIREKCAELQTDFLQLVDPGAPQEADDETLRALETNAVSDDGAALIGQTPDHGGSGGYLEHVFRHAARELFGVQVPEGPLAYTHGRNCDFQEVKLEVDGEVKLHFALAYGFRNIQSIVTKLRRRRCPYHFVEIMACPGGCINGGGQVLAEDTGTSAQSLLARVDAVFHERSIRRPEDNPLCRAVYESLPSNSPFSASARRLLHTQYHAVPKMETSNPLGIKW